MLFLCYFLQDRRYEGGDIGSQVFIIRVTTKPVFEDSRADTNQPGKSRKMTRDLKFPLQEVEG